MGYIREIVEIPATNKSVFQEDMHYINWTENGTQNDAYVYGSYIISDNKWEGNTCNAFILDIAKRIIKVFNISSNFIIFICNIFLFLQLGVTLTIFTMINKPQNLIQHRTQHLHHLHLQHSSGYICVCFIFQLHFSVLPYVYQY